MLWLLSTWTPDGTSQTHLASLVQPCKLELIIGKDLLNAVLVWNCCLSWLSHSRDYHLISHCHLLVTDHCWELPAVNICIMCCHVRVWAVDEHLIMKHPASFLCALKAKFWVKTLRKGVCMYKQASFSFFLFFSYQLYLINLVCFSFTLHYVLLDVLLQGGFKTLHIFKAAR